MTENDTPQILNETSLNQDAIANNRIAVFSYMALNNKTDGSNKSNSSVAQAESNASIGSNE